MTTVLQIVNFDLIKALTTTNIIQTKLFKISIIYIYILIRQFSFQFFKPSLNFNSDTNMEVNSETNVEANSNRPINTKQVSYQQLPAKEKNEVKQLVLLDKFQISLGNEN